MAEEPLENKTSPRIVIAKNGSYHVFGEIPLVHKTQVVSEYGEPLTWKKDKTYLVKRAEGRDFYGLCRCGHSKNKPFCDGIHRTIGFDGTETADTAKSETRSIQYPGSTRIFVKKDPYLCMLSGFCGFADGGIDQLLTATKNTKVRALVMSMVENCPSGALTYRINQESQEIEPDLPMQIAATTEITSAGPIEGPLWVTGNIPIERSDGEPFEIRNRVTLCNCGQSCQKPLCDGTHRELQEKELNEKNL